MRAGPQGRSDAEFAIPCPFLPIVAIPCRFFAHVCHSLPFLTHFGHIEKQPSPLANRSRFWHFSKRGWQLSILSF
jgi:hypothetical protein